MIYSLDAFSDCTFTHKTTLIFSNCFITIYSVKLLAERCFLFPFAAEFWTADDGQAKCECKLTCRETDYVPKMTAYKYINPHVASSLGYTPGERLQHGEGG